MDQRLHQRRYQIKTDSRVGQTGPYRCAFGNVANMDEEATFDVSTIVVDMVWEIGLDPIMVKNPNEDFNEKSAGKS